MAQTEGTSVEWDWGNGMGTGKATKVYTRETTLTIKGTEVTPKASEDQPAYRIEQDGGDEVSKSQSELCKVS